MKKAVYKSLDELPISLNAKDLENILAISRGLVYELFKRPDFPAMEIGGRKLVLKDKFTQWLNKQSEGKIEQ